MSRKEERGRGPQKPTAKDFDSGAVSKAVWSDIIQKPTHLGGWVVAGLGGFAAVIIGGPVTIGLGLAGGAVALGSLANGYRKHDQLCADRVKLLLKQRRDSSRQEIDDFAAKCKLDAFPQGIQESGELWVNYENLIRLLDENASPTDSEALQYRELADNLFDAGVVNLQRVLDLFNVISKVDPDQLTQELEGFKRQRKQAKEQVDQERLDQQIGDHNKRLDQYKEFQRKFKERLAGANRIEGDLETAAGTLADLGIGSTGGNISWTSAAGKLRDAVLAAAESEKELAQLRAGGG